MKKQEHNAELVDALKETLSNAVVLYFAAHRAHWNVEGPDFFEYHGLFEEIYGDVYGSLDSFAENIRKLGGFPPVLSEMEDGAAYEDDSDSSDAKDLALNLYIKNNDFIENLKILFEVASNSNEQGIANFIADRIDKQQKWAWQLRSSLLASGVEIPVTSDSMEEEDDEEDDNETESPDGMEIMDALNELINNTMERMNIGKNADADIPNVLKYEDDNSNSFKKQEELLQNDLEYDTVDIMNEQDLRKSFVRRMIQWLVPDVQENASTSVEVSDTIQEEEDMDIEVLKEALGNVVDEKLNAFATSIKEEVEAAVQEKIDNLSKSFEVQTTELQDKLQATEAALAEQEEQVKAFGKAGAVKKSVDPEDDDEGEQIVKSQPASVWNNVYLPQGLISSLGYRS
jgi:starvation-inducible DNA-binding protein